MKHKFQIFSINRLEEPKIKSVNITKLIRCIFLLNMKQFPEYHTIVEYLSPIRPIVAVNLVQMLPFFLFIWSLYFNTFAYRQLIHIIDPVPYA